MKTTLVPAQVTTVEDKIAGSLSLQQLLLLCAPIFLSGAIYIVLPPFLHLTTVKVILFVLLSIIFSLLAIRVKGKILLMWLIVIGRYNARPRYYIFNKNDAYLRSSSVTKEKVAGPVSEKPIKLEPKLPKIPIPQMVQLQTAMADPGFELSFKADKKGGLNVYITEVK